VIQREGKTMSEKHLEGIEPDLLKKLRRDYCKQKSNAAKRGIEWQFTFESWVKFWGDDVHKRGTGHDRLCMQRFHDAGPYHPDNVRKDYAMQNARTAGVIRRAKNYTKRHTTQQTAGDWDAVYRSFFPENT